MKRRTGFAILFLVTLLTAACGDSSGDSTGAGGTTSVATSPAPTEVQGLIVDIESGESPDDITSFVLESDTDETYEIQIDPDVDYGFNLSHLRVHQTEALPVLVTLRSEGDQLLAVSVVDV